MNYINNKSENSNKWMKLMVILRQNQCFWDPLQLPLKTSLAKRLNFIHTNAKWDMYSKKNN